MSNLASVNENNFETEVLQAKVPVLVDFWASWCGFCIKLTPVLEELSNECSDKIKVVKLNVDENKFLAQKYNVMSLPTIMVFKGGNPVETVVGYLPKEALKAKITPHL